MVLVFFFFLLRMSESDEVAKSLVVWDGPDDSWETNVQISRRNQAWMYKNIPAKGSTGVRCRFRDVDDVGIFSEIGSVKHVSPTSLVDESEPCPSWTWSPSSSSSFSWRSFLRARSYWALAIIFVITFTGKIEDWGDASTDVAVLGFDVTPEIACLMNRLAASVSIFVLPEIHWSR